MVNHETLLMNNCCYERFISQVIYAAFILQVKEVVSDNVEDNCNSVFITACI